jgi:hypothetical protein
VTAYDGGDWNTDPGLVAKYGTQSCPWCGSGNVDGVIRHEDGCPVLVAAIGAIPTVPAPLAGTDEMVLARITIERFLTSEGDDLVRINSDNMNGSDVPVIEALGLLQLAIFDVTNRLAVTPETTE